MELVPRPAVRRMDPSIAIQMVGLGGSKSG